MQRQLEAFIYQVKLNFYRKIFTKVREREGSLSAMEVFSLEVINSLEHPTISQFAKFCGISQPNATYKVNRLIQKGYLERIPSDEDRREFFLKLTDRYYGYAGDIDAVLMQMCKRMEQELSLETKTEVEKLLEKMTSEAVAAGEQQTRGEEQ